MSVFEFDTPEESIAWFMKDDNPMVNSLAKELYSKIRKIVVYDEWPDFPSVPIEIHDADAYIMPLMPHASVDINWCMDMYYDFTDDFELSDDAIPKEVFSLSCPLMYGQIYMFPLNGPPTLKYRGIKLSRRLTNYAAYAYTEYSMPLIPTSLQETCLLHLEEHEVPGGLQKLYISFKHRKSGPAFTTFQGILEFKYDLKELLCK